MLWYAVRVLRPMTPRQSNAEVFDHDTATQPPVRALFRAAALCLACRTSHATVCGVLVRHVCAGALRRTSTRARSSCRPDCAGAHRKGRLPGSHSPARGTQRELSSLGSARPACVKPVQRRAAHAGPSPRAVCSSCRQWGAEASMDRPRRTDVVARALVGEAQRGRDVSRPISCEGLVVEGRGKWFY